MFYDKFAYLCKQKGVSPSRAAIDAGISKSLVTKWKTNNIQDPSADIARKLATYFGVSVADLISDDIKKENSPDQNLLTEGEQVFIDLLRKIPAEKKPIVLRILTQTLQGFLDTM